MPWWNDICDDHPILITVVALLLLIILGVVIDPELKGLEGLALS